MTERMSQETGALLARCELRHAKNRIEEAEAYRLYAISQGLTYGLSEREIAAEVGLTGPRINQLKKQGKVSADG